MVICSAFIGAVGQIEFKRGAGLFDLTFNGMITNYHIITGLCLYACATVLYLVALKEGELSLLYPIIATSYIWVLLFSKYFFDEPVNMINAFGVCIIIVGITLISYR